MAERTNVGNRDLASDFRERWLAIQAETIGPDVSERRQWTGLDDIAKVLARVADGRMGTWLVTPRHFVAPPGDRTKATTEGVENAGGPVRIDVETDTDGTPVLAIKAGTWRTWLEPDTLTYLPCQANPLNAVFSLTVAGSVEPPPGTRYTREDLLRDPASNSEPARWVTGGVMFVCTEIESPLSFKSAPEVTWNNFPALERWVARTNDTPPPRTTAEGLADPATLTHIRNAFATNRERTGRQNKPLDQSDVDAIGRAVYDMGLQLTVQLVREVVGGGSPSTIHPLLKSFWARAKIEGLLSSAPPAATTLPAELTQLYEALVDAARVAADEDLKPARELLQRRETSLTAAELKVAEGKEAVDQKARELAGTLEQLELQVADLKGQRDEAQRALESAQHIAVGDAALISELRAEVAGVREAAQKLSEEMIAMNAAIGQRDADLAACKAERDAYDRESREATIKYGASELRFTQVTEQLNERLKADRAAHAAAVTRLSADLTEARERAQALEADRNARAARVIQLEATVAEGAAARATLEDERKSALERVSALTVDLRVAERERDRLSATAAAEPEG